MKKFISKQEVGLSECVAGATRDMLHRRGIKTISLVGPPRSGKTALLEKTTDLLADHARVCVLVGNPAADLKIIRLGRHGIQARPLPEGKLDAAGVHEAVSRLNLDQIDLLLIEGSSDMKELPQRNHGQDLCVSVFSVTAGSTQPAAFAHLIKASDLVLLTMTDLLPHQKFDPATFMAGIHRIRPDVPVIEVSVIQANGVRPWLHWLEQHWLGARPDRIGPHPVDAFVDLSL